MRTLYTIITQNFYRTLRHPNRGLLPVLLYSLVGYLGVSLGLENMVPAIDGLATSQWMIPNMVMFGIMLLAYQHTAWEYAEREMGEYLRYLRSTPVSNGVLLLSYILEAALRSLLKSVLIVLLFWVLWGNIGAVTDWLIFYAVTLPVSLFFSAIGISLALQIRKVQVNSHFFVEVIIPLIGISGLLFPVTQYPRIITITTYAFPPGQAFSLGHSVFQAAPWDWWILGGLVGWAIAGIILAFLFFKKEEWK